MFSRKWKVCAAGRKVIHRERGDEKREWSNAHRISFVVQISDVFFVACVRIHFVKIHYYIWLISVHNLHNTIPLKWYLYMAKTVDYKQLIQFIYKKNYKIDKIAIIVQMKHASIVWILERQVEVIMDWILLMDCKL